MLSPLFRSELAAAQQQNWLGEVQILSQPSLRASAFISSLLLLGVSAFSFYGSYTRRVHANGQVQPSSGLITIASPKTGRISTAFVHEGDHVLEGQLLYRINVDADSQKGPTQNRIVAQLELQKKSLEKQKAAKLSLASIEKQLLRSQLDNCIEQNEQLKKQIDVQEKLEEPIKNRADQLAQFVDRGLARSAEYQSQNYLYLQADSQLTQFRQAKLQIEGKILDLKAQIAGFEDKLAREVAEIDRSAAQIELSVAESDAQAIIEVRAPKEGNLTSIKVHSGQDVTIGGALLTLLPGSGQLQINLYVDSKAIGFIRTGQVVMLRYAAFPFQRFGLHRGTIIEVTRAPFDDKTPHNLRGMDPQKNEAIYRVIVKPNEEEITIDGVAQALEVGMSVEADISLEKRALYLWMLDPIDRLKQSVGLVFNGDT